MIEGTSTIDDAPSAGADRVGWSDVVALMKRPQRVTLPMVALFAIVPLYLYIGQVVRGRTLHVPAIALDRALPVVPAWTLVYGSLFLAALLPVFVVHRQELIRRTIWAFLFIWLAAYACFIAYPTIGPRPIDFAGDGFAAWALRLVYSSDVRCNCLPSLHVAQCFLAAAICSRVHRGIGAVGLVWAFGVGVSTLYTKQHYVLDVVGGIALAAIAHLIFLRSYPLDDVPARERRLAPALALGAVGAYGVIVAILWTLYALGIEP